MATGAVLSQPTTQPANSAQNPQNLYQAIPGLSGMLGQAGTNITNLLSGQPSASWAQTNAAYFGAGAGQPNTNVPGSFTANMGANLYNQQSNANQQTGLGDLMSLIGTASGNLSPSAAQNQSSNFNYAQLGQQGSEFQQSLAEQQFNDQINALIGLSNSGIGGTGGGGSGASPFPSSDYLSNNPGGIGDTSGYSIPQYVGSSPLNTLSLTQQGALQNYLANPGTLADFQALGPLGLNPGMVGV